MTIKSHDIKELKTLRNRNVFAESAGLAVAEFTTAATSLGIVAVADSIAPDLLKSASKALAKVCIEPHLEAIEVGMSKICKLEECKPDPTKTREERAESLAHTVIVFSAAWAGSMIVKLATRKLVNHATDVEPHKELPTGNWFKDKILFRWLNKHDWKVIGFDEGIHLGSLILVNTGAAKHADTMIASSTRVLQKTLGWDEKRAKAVSSMAVIWELPNMLGLAAGIGVAANHHNKIYKAAVGKLENQLPNTTPSHPSH